MKKILKNLILIVLMLAAIFALTGCAITSTSNITPQNVTCSGFVLPWVTFEKETPEKTIISSRDELEKYCEKLEPNTTSSTECHPINLFDKYDKEYFKNSSLAILQIQSFSYENLNFTQATKDGDSVKIEYTIKEDLKISSVIKDYRYIVVEIDKQITNIIESEKE